MRYYDDDDVDSGADRNASEIAIVPIDNSSRSGHAKIQAVERYRKTLKYISKALKLSDAQIKKKKLRDIPKLFKKAKDEITVGQMGDLIMEEKLTFGDRINHFFCRFKRNCGCN